MSNQAFCKSYYDDKNKLQDCTCGECNMTDLEKMLSEIGEVTIWHDLENYDEAQWVAKGSGLEAGESLDEAIKKLHAFVMARKEKSDDN